MSRYPGAEWVPWLYIGASGRPAFYRGGNLPSAVVLHIMEGYVSTVRGWARTGYAEASWHFSIGRDGTVYQHLELTDGGYHAGITDARAAARPPVWPMWQGPGINVNFYTIGIEHEGFAGPPFPEAQAAASRDLCRWLAATLGIPFDRDHFPPHADIDLVNRPNDFNMPIMREAHYRYLFEEEDEVTRAEFEEQQKQILGLLWADSIRNQQVEKLKADIVVLRKSIADHILTHEEE